MPNFPALSNKNSKMKHHVLTSDGVLVHVIAVVFMLYIPNIYKDSPKEDKSDMLIKIILEGDKKWSPYIAALLPISCT